MDTEKFNSIGTRSQLESEGIDPYLIYTSIVSGNPSGGIRQGRIKIGLTGIK